MRFAGLVRAAGVALVVRRARAGRTGLAGSSTGVGSASAGCGPAVDAPAPAGAVNSGASGVLRLAPAAFRGVGAAFLAAGAVVFPAGVVSASGVVLSSAARRARFGVAFATEVAPVAVAPTEGPPDAVLPVGTSFGVGSTAAGG
ncbi:hypothetical protein ACN27B_08415 [Micromonospora sp. WMMD754]|uniref:hypothetical protein n=1 Tax=unclassified Micromonospora TaxID=2617518 RepID=UPI0015620906|nr:hypothetical protein [Micromonospora sp. WMMA2032]